MGKKKSAKDSLSKLSRGLTRETPATRAGGAEDGGGKNVAESRPGESVAEPGNQAGGERRTPGRRGRPRTKPERMVRVSVDVVRSDHKYLRDFAYDEETDSMSVMRALLHELQVDAALAERVRVRVAEAKAGE